MDVNNPINDGKIVSKAKGVMNFKYACFFVIFILPELQRLSVSLVHSCCRVSQIQLSENMRNSLFFSRAPPNHSVCLFTHIQGVAWELNRKTLSLNSAYITRYTSLLLQTALLATFGVWVTQYEISTVSFFTLCTTESVQSIYENLTMFWIRARKSS